VYKTKKKKNQPNKKHNNKTTKKYKHSKNTPPAPERLWQQPNLHGNLLEEADLGAFGVQQPKLMEDIIRVGS
jgi:hypothetical protein